MAQAQTTDKLLDLAGKLPPGRLLSYARLWQFETWLRTMTYVELRTRYGGSWTSHLNTSNRRAYENDKRLLHMPTRETFPTSYMQLGDLLSTISNNWCLFETYLPPKDLWNAKIDELQQIRHRVAHFRLGHGDDLRRVEQLLRDVDKGFWRFCTSYNSLSPILPPSDDTVTERFLSLDCAPWTEVGPAKWMRIGIADRSLAISTTIEISRRDWLKSPGTPVLGKYGTLYDVVFFARNEGNFDYSSFLNDTKHVHQHICHICLDGHARRIRVTIPTVLGGPLIIETIETLLRVARSSFRSGSIVIDFDQVTDVGKMIQRTVWADTLAEAWPEYVLGPSNPLTYLDPQMPCSFFDAT